jgi:hypothetical protein
VCCVHVMRIDGFGARFVLKDMHMSRIEERLQTILERDSYTMASEIRERRETGVEPGQVSCRINGVILKARLILDCSYLIYKKRMTSATCQIIATFTFPLQ